MRKKGSGSITRLPSGNFRARVGRDGPSATYATREEAEGALRGTIADMRERGVAPSGSLTLAQWAEQWFRERERDGYRGTREDRSVWVNRIAPYQIASLCIATITRKHVREWIDTIRDVPVSRRSKKGRVIRTDARLAIGSLRRIRAVVRSMLATAVEREIIPANPAGGFAINAPTGAPRWTYLSKAEVDSLLSHDLVPLRFRLIYSVAIHTGLRRGEMWALKWSDVDTESARPHIYVRGSHKGATKTGKHRIVPLLPQAVNALRRLRSIVRHNEPEHFVFATSTGAQRGKNDRGQWGRNGPHPGYRVTAGFTRKVPFHAFRHTCASGLLQGYWSQPWTLEEVRDMLGHASVAVTQRYAHLSTEHLHARARAAIGSTTTLASDGNPPSNDVLRQVSTIHDGPARFTEEYRSIGGARDDIVSTARAFLERVSDRSVQRVALSEFLVECVGTQWEASAQRCIGDHALRKAIVLADQIVRAELSARADASAREA